MLNRDYLEYISSIDDDLRYLLDFKDEEVLKCCTVSLDDFKTYISPYLHGFDVDALYCLCVYVIHLLSHNKVWATQNSISDDYFELMSKLRKKSITKISFGYLDDGSEKQISLTNYQLVQAILEQLEVYRRFVEFTPQNIIEIEASEYVSSGSVRDILFMVLTELIKHNTEKDRITPNNKELVVRILYLFNLRQEIVHNQDNKYCEREVYDSIKSKIKTWAWFPIPNSPKNPYPSPQQIKTHDRFKGKKIPRRSSKRSGKGCIES